MIKNFIILGIPGVGKGTIASKVAKEKGIIHISTGNIFREYINKETELGIKIKEIISSGKYVSNKIVNSIVKEKLQQDIVKKRGFILDGYPRTINQVKFLDSIIDKNNLKIIWLKSNEKIILKRLAIRLKEEKRKDDSENIINKRMKIFNEKTLPLIKYYEKNNNLITIDAEGTIKENIKKFYKECFFDHN